MVLGGRGDGLACADQCLVHGVAHGADRYLDIAVGGDHAAASLKFFDDTRQPLKGGSVLFYDRCFWWGVLEKPIMHVVKALVFCVAGATVNEIGSWIMKERSENNYTRAIERSANEFVGLVVRRHTVMGSEGEVT